MFSLLVRIFVCGGVSAWAMAAPAWDAPARGNPILPGYYADPTAIEHEGRYYLYATLDPWGGDTLGCWESPDFKQWTFRTLNWPTKAACTSPTSKSANVWAPSVVRGGDGRFHLFVSVGSEIWTGVADHPLGPWRNALGDRPLIAADYNPAYHMIDADAFVDDDGEAYLYWGSGWNWVNGACFAVRLGKDLASLAGEVKVVTPAHYFEGPTMLKHGGRYYLTYSQGKTVSDSYEVRYAVGEHPLGPFVEAGNSPILTTDRARQIVSPGHHGFFAQGGRHYLLYHRHRVPFVEGTAFRQVCVDALHFNATGEIERIVPTHEGPEELRRADAASERPAQTARGAVFAAGSAAEAWTGPEAAFDDNYATRWVAGAGSEAAWLHVDLGEKRAIAESELRLEYAWKAYRCWIEVSDEGKTWTTVADRRAVPVSGSPIVLPHAVAARYVRLQFVRVAGEPEPAVWEWQLR